MAVARVFEFDTWKPGYGGASVEVLKAGTTDQADIYFDLDMTDPAPNPQTLQSQSVNNTQYGKFAASIYTQDDYYLKIESTDETGITRPSLTTVVGEDVSESVASTARGGRTRDVQDILDQIIHAEDYGEIGASGTTNSATIAAAIGAASNQGGGVVMLPAGDIVFETLTLSEGVILQGQGLTGTTLRSTEGEEVITLGGDWCGLFDLELDGENLVGNSVGIYSEGNHYILFQNLRVRRFETGLKFHGGLYNDWRNLLVENCTDNCLLTGENAFPFEQNKWVGGNCIESTNYGLRLAFADDWVRFNSFDRILFNANVDTALSIEGARFSHFSHCTFTENINDLDVADGADTSESDRNYVVGLTFEDCLFDSGEMTFDDTCETCVFERCQFNGTTLNMELPENNVTLVDCLEDSDVEITGNSKNLLRRRTELSGEVRGVTTSSNFVTAWEYTIPPGSGVSVDAVCIGIQRNGENTGFYHIGQFAHRPGSELNYVGQSATFTVGAIVEGQTSGATGRIIADNNTAPSGTLTLKDIVGEFEDNEVIIGSSGGEAQVDGTLISQDAVALGSETAIKAAVEDNVDWDAQIAVSAAAGKVQVQVVGDTDETVEWTVNVTATVT